ncbi:MAG: hypothetical protein H0X66_11740 [Verrucomicrobia bacterium]|nr:hypothetical protein [Verrucomicrobiota bacterium]
MRAMLANGTFIENTTDKWFHCVTSCELARTCGEDTAAILSFLRELGTSIGSENTKEDSRTDKEADRIGRGCKDKPYSCEQECLNNGYMR